MKTSTAKTKTDLNVRRWPAIDKNNISGRLRPDELVTVYEYSETDTDRTWRYITTAKVHGWVAGEYLSSVAPTAPQPPTAPTSNPAITTQVCLHSFATNRGGESLWALEQLVKAGRPAIGHVYVKGEKPWESDYKIADIKRVSPTTKVLHRIHRKAEGSQIDWNNPNAGREYATWYYANFLTGDYAAGYDLKDADYDQLINEPSPTIPNYFDPVIFARFWNQVLDVAEPLGRHIGMGCFSERTPQHEFWEHPAIEALLDRILAGGHIIVLHNYVIDPTADPNNAQGRCYSWEYNEFQSDRLYRFEQVIKRLKDRHKQIPIWVAEFGDINFLRCGVDHFKRNLAAAVKAVKRFSNVAVFIWAVDTGGSDEQWTDAGGADIRGWIREYVDMVKTK